MNWSDVELVWREGFEPPEGVEEIVRADMENNLDGLEKPSDLIFHTVFLTDDMEGPSVVISGFTDRDDAFDAGYYT